MEKPYYILQVETESKEIFSVMGSEVLLHESTINYLDKSKNTTTVFTESILVDKGVKYKSKIYKTSSGFYIYCKSISGDDKFEASVYHRPENLNEVIIFLKQLNKY
jgi:hypothetical protein